MTVFDLGLLACCRCWLSCAMVEIVEGVGRVVELAGIDGVRLNPGLAGST